MNKILYSVIVPVYKVENYVKECIESVLHQTYRNYELILVDDGSPDNSGTICDGYSNGYEKITVYHIKNEGALHARMFGVSRAHGDYVVFLDADDLLEKKALEVIDKTVREDNCDCVIYGMVLFQGEKITESITVADRDIIIDKHDLYEKCFFSPWYNSLCRKAVKKTILSGVDCSDYYHVSLGEDLLLSLDILKNSQTVCFIPDILYRYRMNPGSATHSITALNNSVDFTAFKKVIDFLYEEDVFSKSEIADYRSYCASLICNTVQTISSFKIDRKEKKRLLASVYNSDFFQKEILNQSFSVKRMPKWKRIVYYLLRKKHYNRLLIFLRVKRLAASIIRNR